ncbi:hypothetical protein FKM82_027247 [Ascaphus truei]
MILSRIIIALIPKYFPKHHLCFSHNIHLSSCLITSSPSRPPTRLLLCNLTFKVPTMYHQTVPKPGIPLTSNSPSLRPHWDQLCGSTK